MIDWAAINHSHCTISMVLCMIRSQKDSDICWTFPRGLTNRFQTSSRASTQDSTAFVVIIPWQLDEIQILEKGSVLWQRHDKRWQPTGWTPETAVILTIPTKLCMIPVVDPWKRVRSARRLLFWVFWLFSHWRPDGMNLWIWYDMIHTYYDIREGTPSHRDEIVVFSLLIMCICHAWT